MQVKPSGHATPLHLTRPNCCCLVKWRPLTPPSVRDEDEDVEFGQRLAKVRELRGDTQFDLAQAIGVHPAQVSRWETGTRGPTATWYRKILRHYHTEALYLIHGDNLPEPVPNPALAKYLETPPGKLIESLGRTRQLAEIAQTLASPDAPTELTYSRVGGLLLQEL